MLLHNHRGFNWHVAKGAMQLSCYLHKAWVTPSFTLTGVPTGHYRTSLILKCSVLVKHKPTCGFYSQEGGRKIPKILLAVATRDLFFTHSWWAWAEQSTLTLELHTCLRNTFEGTSALAISLHPPINAETDLTWGTDDFEKRGYWEKQAELCKCII